MKAMRAGLILALVQVVLVLSVAGKYLYERETRPRVWTRATQFDPSLPLRGRYVALQLMVDACGLPRDAEHTIPGIPEDIRSGAGMYRSPRRTGNWRRGWRSRGHRGPEGRSPFSQINLAIRRL